MAEQKNNLPEQDLSQQTKVRREKLAALQAEGKDPFQITRFEWDATSAQIKEHFDEMEGQSVKVAGRLMSKRGMGKVSFCDLQDVYKRQVITLPEGTEMCMPGDNVEMSVELITPIAIEKGLRFAIREGGRTVGSGAVTEVEEK